jgi:hypothetical protein
LVGGDEVTGEDGVALLWITWIGLSLSIACLVLTAVVLATSPALKSKLHNLILLNLVVALGAAQLLFFFITEPKSTSSCTGVSGLLLYFLLAFFFWMNVEANNLYVTFVRHDVWDNSPGTIACKIRRYMLCAWGLPLFFVVGGAMTDMDGLITTADAMVGGAVVGSTISYCWVDKDGTAKWFFFVPMLVSLTFNCVITVIVFRQVQHQLAIRLQRGIHRLSTRASEAAQGIRIMIKVASVTGIGWLVAVLVLFGVGGTAMQYLFTVLNAFQGCLIFVVHVVQKEDGRAFFASLRKSLSSRGSSRKNKIVRMDRVTRETEAVSSTRKMLTTTQADGESHCDPRKSTPWSVTQRPRTTLPTPVSRTSQAGQARRGTVDPSKPRREGQRADVDVGSSTQPMADTKQGSAEFRVNVGAPKSQCNVHEACPSPESPPSPSTISTALSIGSGSEWGGSDVVEADLCASRSPEGRVDGGNSAVPPLPTRTTRTSSIV